MHSVDSCYKLLYSSIVVTKDFEIMFLLAALVVVPITNLVIIINSYDLFALSVVYNTKSHNTMELL